MEQELLARFKYNVSDMDKNNFQLRMHRLETLMSAMWGNTLTQQEIDVLIVVCFRICLPMTRTQGLEMLYVVKHYMQSDQYRLMCKLCRALCEHDKKSTPERWEEDWKEWFEDEEYWT